MLLETLSEESEIVYAGWREQGELASSVGGDEAENQRKFAKRVGNCRSGKGLTISFSGRCASSEDHVARVLTESCSPFLNQRRGWDDVS